MSSDEHNTSRGPAMSLPLSGDGMLARSDPRRIVNVHGNYPSDGGIGERAVWFRDSEGNLIGIGQAIH